MPAPWVDVQNDIVEGTGFLRLVPITLTGSNTIQAYGTKIDLLQVTDEGEDYSMAEPKTDFITKELSTGYVLEYPKISFTISAITGQVKSKSDQVDQIEVKALIGKATFDSILANKGKPFAVCKGLGFNTQGQIVGFAHLIGYLGNIKTSEKHELMEVGLTIKGGFQFLKGSTTYTTYNTAMTQTTIEPVGASSITIKALTTTDYDKLMEGVIVRTDKA